MNKRKLLKLLGAISATTILGAIGSGVWAVILEPTYTKSINSILNLTTLGIESIKTSMYLEIAQGFHEKSSLKTYKFSQLIYIVSIIGFAIFAIFKSKQIQTEHKEILTVLENDIKGEQPKNVSLKELHQRVLAINTQKVVNLSISLMLLLIFLCTLNVFSIVKATYTNNAITHFHQMHQVVRPYISEEKSFKILSQFSQITKKSDYIQIM